MLPLVVCHECQEELRVAISSFKWVRNYTRDGGRPSEAALQEEASNHSKLHWSKARVVSVREKGSWKTSGKRQGDEAIEPLLKCRKDIDELKTERGPVLRDKLGGHLFTGQVVSGIEVA
jgi:hypothetical protein